MANDEGTNRVAKSPKPSKTNSRNQDRLDVYPDGPLQLLLSPNVIDLAPNPFGAFVAIRSPV